MMTRSSLLSLLLPSVIRILVVGIAVTDPATADDWYRWRGPSLDGVSTEKNWRSHWPEGEPKPSWTTNVGTGFSSFVVKGDLAYTTGHLEDADVVFCLSAQTGQTIWKFGYPAALDDRDFEGGPTSTPTLDDDRLYVLSRVGEVFCLDAMSGELRWTKQVADEADVRLPGWGFAASPLIIGEKLLLNMGESGIALNKLDGSILWSSQDRECGYASPVNIPDTNPSVAVFASGRAFIGVNVETGETSWNERWLTSFNCNAADPIIHDGKMFLSSGYNRGAALFDLTESKPKLIWKTKEMQNQLHSSLLFEGHLYGIDGDMDTGARLKCIAWDTGEVIWSVDDLQPGGISIAGGQLIVMTESGELLFAPASPDGWKPQTQAKILDGKCRTVPVFSGGRVFCRSIQGQVACVDCRE